MPEPGTAAVRCPDCDGAGEQRRVRQSILGQMITAVPCPRCQGSGQFIETPCADCRGEGRRNERRTLTVDIPAGVDEGSTLRLAGHGPAGFRGGPNGALFVHVSVEPDPVFERSGVDLHAPVHVPVTMAALGGTIGFETLDGDRDLTIAPGTQTGTVIPLKSLGVPRLRGRGRGELYVHVEVDTPTALDDRQKELLAHAGRGPGGRAGFGPPRRGTVLEAALGPQLTMGGGPAAPAPDLRTAAAMVYVADLGAPVLTESDVHHLVDVLRLRTGEVVVASDGAGSWVPCRLTSGRRPSGVRPTVIGPRGHRCQTEPTAAGARHHRGLRPGQGRPARVGGPEAH